MNFADKFILMGTPLWGGGGTFLTPPNAHLFFGSMTENKLWKVFFHQKTADFYW